MKCKMEHAKRKMEHDFPRLHASMPPFYLFFIFDSQLNPQSP